ALKELPRAKVQLATKFGIMRLEGGKPAVKGTPEYVRQACEASLKRLGIDYIDLYYQHRVDPTVPIEDTMGELKKLVDEGKIKYIGLSEASADTMRRAQMVHPITAIQVEYSLWTRDIEEDIIPLCRELGIGIVAYSPLGRGFFGGKAVVEALPDNSILPHWPRFTGENLEKNKQLYDRLANLAAKKSCTPPQLALAWLLHQEDNIVPIPGTTKVKNLHNNLGALSLKLTEEDLKEISEAVPIDGVAGERDADSVKQYSRKFASTPKKCTSNSNGRTKEQLRGFWNQQTPVFIDTAEAIEAKNSRKRKQDMDNAVATVRSIRDVPPAHYSLKLTSFSLFLNADIGNYTSRVFEAGGYKWKLCVHPNGNEKMNVGRHISLYLVIADTETLPPGWEVNVNFKLFVFDQIRDKYLAVQDAEGDPANNIYTWRIEKFSATDQVDIRSDEFVVGGSKWKLRIYPKGDSSVDGKWLSFYLLLAGRKTLPFDRKIFAECKLRVRDEVYGNHSEKEDLSSFDVKIDNLFEDGAGDVDGVDASYG
ncbi:hypothetical protein C3L33_12702, partial [Rhododendron williamsianum]